MADGKLYLGKEFSLIDSSRENEPYLYKTDNLTTHGIVFGMTGSGKTGLCLDLLEEVIDEDVPIVLIDPKGDLANLALLFPEFSPEDFKQWVSPTDAAKKGKTLDEYAGDVAAKWKKGLEDWGVKKEQIQRIKEKIDLHIYTPGSSAGERISILNEFKNPGENFEDDEEALVEKIRNSVSALLALLDIENDPLKSKPHILLSNIIEYYWKLGRSLSIEELIMNIQKPPFKKLGVFDIDQLIDEKERTELSFEINNIIASPSFRFWATGLPLSAETLYKGNAKSGSKGKSKSAAQKKVPVSIFYIAHLTGNERMFMVTLLLNEILYWIRTQPGSGNLKYLLYMDEIFGYLPPYPQNPPSKTPLLLMLKQARAFGLGLVLATQNPKDIDYKALTNMGTWFIGKLQADGDRERILEGLPGITMKSGKTVEKKQLKEIMTSLNNRKFLVKNVHSKGLSLFQTRWAMSYLAGPLTRDQLKILVKERKRALKQKTLPGTGAPQKTLDSAQTTSQTKTNRTNKSAKKGPHLLPFIPEPGIPLENFFDNNAMQGHYSPCLYLDGEVIFDDNRHGLYIRKKYFVSTPLAASVNWRKATIEEKEIPYSLDPTETAGYLPYPVKIDYKLIKRLSTSFKNFLFTNLSVELLSNKDLNLLSGIDESKQAFQLKCRDVVEKMIDRDVEKIKESYSKKIRRLRDRAQREELKIEKLEEEQKSKRNEELFSAGETVLGFLLGGKSRRGLSSAARKRRATTSAANKVRIGKTKLQQLNEQLLELREELEDKVADIEDKFYEKADNITAFEVRLEKNDIIISNQAILWKLVNK